LRSFDVAIIGGGSGGFPAALRLASRGKRVVLFEREQIGGTCLNWGCIPTKALLSLAHAAFKLARLSPGARVLSLELKKVMEHKDRAISALRSDLESLLSASGVELIRGEARLVQPGVVEHEGGRVRASFVVVATGSRPAPPPLEIAPGAQGVWGSREVLSAEELPGRCVVLGGGVQGLEMAAFLSAMGSEVSVVEIADEVLPGEDRDLAGALRAEMERGLGVRFYLRTKASSWDGTKLRGVGPGGESVEVPGDKLVVLIGRKPCLDGIEVGKVGLGTCGGALAVDGRMRTNVPGHYAVGDVTGQPMLAHAAMRGSLIAAADVLGEEVDLDLRLVPRCVYTFPELASCGLTGEELERRGIPHRVEVLSLSSNGRAVAEGESGLLKLVLSRDGGRILGASLLAPFASEMIGFVSGWIRAGVGLDELRRSLFFPHPTVSESMGDLLFRLGRVV